MKIVQTLGRAGGVHEGVFCYKRTSKGVHIDASISSKYTLKKKNLRISNAAWNKLPKAIEKLQNPKLRITQPKSSKNSTEKETAINHLHGLIHASISPNINDSMKAYIIAILEHEGTIDIDHGKGGAIPLRRSN
jgi:hypothetical protein